MLKAIMKRLYSAWRVCVWRLRYGTNIRIPFQQNMAFGTVISCGRESTVTIGRKISTYSGVNLSAAAGGKLVIEDKAFFNRNCIIVARKEILIGIGVMIGPNVCIYDHDHLLTVEGVASNEYSCVPIQIGSKCWIGANATLLKGTTLGDGCVVGAGTVVQGNFPANTLIYNKREIVTRALADHIANQKGPT